MAKVYIGTSGWVYPHWKGIFYPKDLKEKEWLSFYSQNFASVEINSSFYHSMAKKVYQGWSQKVSDDFVFAIKGSRFISHVKRLKDCREPLERLLEESSGLGKKRGVILFQLPPRWQADEKRLESFLVHCSQFKVHGRRKTVNSEPSTVNRFAFEFRDKSWLEDKILSILKKYNAALCIQDSPYWPSREVVTSNFVYLRFHGGKMLYTSNYSDRELKAWAENIKKWLNSGFDVFAYFNNDAMGYAIENAKTLEKLLQS
jgi:uncharacterized protein YecE (DUF72 family)